MLLRTYSLCQFRSNHSKMAEKRRCTRAEADFGAAMHSQKRKSRFQWSEELTDLLKEAYKQHGANYSKLYEQLGKYGVSENVIKSKLSSRAFRNWRKIIGLCCNWSLFLNKVQFHTLVLCSFYTLILGDAQHSEYLHKFVKEIQQQQPHSNTKSVEVAVENNEEESDNDEYEPPGEDVTEKDYEEYEVRPTKPIAIVPAHSYEPYIMLLGKEKIILGWKTNKS